METELSSINEQGITFMMQISDLKTENQSLKNEITTWTNGGSSSQSSSVTTTTINSSSDCSASDGLLIKAQGQITEFTSQLQILNMQIENQTTKSDRIEGKLNGQIETLTVELDTLRDTDN